MQSSHITSHGIAKRLIIATVLISSLLTLLITGFQLFNEYKNEIAQIDNNYKQMKLTYLPSLTESLWVIDKVQTEKILDGLLRIPEFEYISIVQDGALTWERGSHISSRFRKESIPMSVTYNNEERSVGRLTVIIGLDRVYTDLVHRALTILIANALKTFIVSGFMLIIIYHLITKHLFMIVDYANSQKFGENSFPVAPLKLDRKQKKGGKLDELGQLENAINSMYKRLWVSNFKLKEDEKELKKYRDHLEETVKERTKHLIETKEEAIRANAAKTEFLARMSHELRTPLNAVLGFGQVLEMDDSINVAQKSHVKDIIQAGRHLLDLIDEVLDLTSIESGSISVTVEPVSLSQTVFESIATVKPLAQKKGIQIENKFQPDDEINVLAAKTHLKEVLLNLLSNAIKYGRENGHINVGYTLLPDNCIKLEIIDDGRGIDIKAHAMVFEPFARLGAEYTDIEGTGIGLTISKRLIELMGGEIGFTSVKNKGCTFYIQLPLSGESAKVPDTPESANR